MRLTRPFASACLLLLCACGAPASAARARPQPVADARDASGSAAVRHTPALQRTLDSLLRTGRFPGVSVGVALRDGSSVGVAAGWSDTARRIPLTPAHLLLQGSVGKTYVSAVALQLVAEGRLRLDDRIAVHLGDEPWFAQLPNARDITVRQLMNHTSGLVRYEFKPQFTRDLTAAPDRHWEPRELLSYVLGEAPPFAAGSGWEYSDTNYIVLGLILERIAGRSYYAELERRVFVPLALTATVPSTSRRIPGLSQGYAGANNPFGGTDAMIDAEGRFAFNPQFEWTGGGIASTAEDLARWGAALYAGTIVPDSIRREMLGGVPAPLGPPGTTYGLGVIVRPPGPFGVTWGHSGFFPGYVTELLHYPTHGVTIAVMINTSAQGMANPSPARVAGALMRVLVEEPPGR